MQYQTNDVIYEEYVVKPKDSLYTIAKEFKTTIAELTDINMLTTNKSTKIFFEVRLYLFIIFLMTPSKRRRKRIL